VHEMMRARFGKLVEMNKEEWTHEFAYWVTRGWLEE